MLFAKMAHGLCGGKYNDIIEKATVYDAKRCSFIFGLNILIFTLWFGERSETGFSVCQIWVFKNQQIMVEVYDCFFNYSLKFFKMGSMSRV